MGIAYILVSSMVFRDSLDKIVTVSFMHGGGGLFANSLPFFNNLIKLLLEVRETNRFMNVLLLTAYMQ